MPCKVRVQQAHHRGLRARSQFERDGVLARQHIREIARITNLDPVWGKCLDVLKCRGDLGQSGREHVEKLTDVVRSWKLDFEADHSGLQLFLGRLVAVKRNHLAE